MPLRHDIRRIGELLAPEKTTYPLGILALLVVNCADVLAPLFLAMAVELTESELTKKIPATPRALEMLGLDAAAFTLVGAVVVYLVLHVVANIARYPMLMYSAVPSHRIGQRVRRRITDRLVAQSSEFFDRSKSGDLMSIATADVNAVRMMVGPGILIAADTIILVTLVLLVLFVLSWKLALVALIPLPIIYAVTNRLSHLEFKGFESVQEDLAEMTERVRESYAGVRILQGYAREDFDRDRFVSFSLRHYTRNLYLARVRAVFDPTLDLMLGVSTVLVLVLGGIWVARGEVSIATFVATIFLIRYLSGPMIGFGWSISLFQRGRASLHRIDRLAETPVSVVDSADAIDANLDGAITIRGLSFAYTGPRIVDDVGDASVEEVEGPVEALHDVSFSVAAGETLGVFGPVGCGKSTLVSLIVRLYEPPHGTIFVDGNDVRDLSLASLRGQVVLAPQETFLFSTTVERNVLLAAGPDATREDVERFARLAKLHEEIGEFPGGYQTLLGERGVNLSGGQRQRLAIARAIAADPRVLILDDCLSAVDAETEDAILHNLRDVFDGRTGIIVSHRVRAVSECDRIVVLDEGRVVETGTHAELLARDGYYAQIARQQGDRGPVDVGEAAS